MSELTRYIAALEPDTTPLELTAYGATVTISYTEEPAVGDNGQVVPGYTTGTFFVRWNGGRERSIHVGPNPRAKSYHAEQIAKDFMSRATRAKYTKGA